ncbi:MAG: hypothetical protein MI923_30660 [Phycisphaerales bacterium]|nr:hypothetical protein [Phycisphaerales bacterium]
MKDLYDYYLSDKRMFLIPIEHLSANGMSATFQDLLLERSLVSEGWIELFNEAFRHYDQRASDLAAQAPRHWFPSRLQHACIVTEPARVRPYSQPFNKCSWLLYETDFDPATSNREFAAFQFFQAERLGLVREVISASLRNLSYYLICTDEEIERFCEGCRRSNRPDAVAYRAVAEAMPWIRRLYHESLKKPVLATIEPLIKIPQTGLLIPRSLQANLDELIGTWTKTAQDAMAEFQTAHQPRKGLHTEKLCGWLEATQPCVLITGPPERVLWDPDKPREIEAVRSALGDTADEIAKSIEADLQVIDERSRGFFMSLRRPEDLPMPHTEMEESGLSYLHVGRRMIAYNLLDKVTDRLNLPSPPYERDMLAARTIHEWGHQAVDAGLVPIATSRQADHEQYYEQLADLLDEIYRNAPAGARSITAASMARLADRDESPGHALARVATNRVCDFQANLLSQNYLTLAERETYIRNNVYALILESAGTELFQRLARHVYEYQYLRFSRIDDPLAYFLGSTWFGEQYLKTGILTDTQFKNLLSVVGKLCDCYEVDQSKFVTAGGSI